MYVIINRVGQNPVLDRFARGVGGFFRVFRFFPGISGFSGCLLFTSSILSVGTYNFLNLKKAWQYRVRKFLMVMISVCMLSKQEIYMYNLHVYCISKLSMSLGLRARTVNSTSNNEYH